MRRKPATQSPRRGWPGIATGSRHCRHPPDPEPGHTACLCLQQGKKPTQRINKRGKKNPPSCRSVTPGRAVGIAGKFRTERPRQRSKVALTRGGKVCAGVNRARTRERGPEPAAGAGAGRAGGAGRREALAACPEPGLLGSCRNRVEREEDGELVSSRPRRGGAFLSPGERGAPHEAAAAVPQFLRIMK